MFGMERSSASQPLIHLVFRRSRSCQCLGLCSRGCRVHTPPLHATVLRGHLDMATYDALERLQKFDWLIQKLHNIRSTLQSEQGLQELQKLHALQLLQKSDYHFNGASIGESEDDKMELCKNEGEEEDEEEVLDEEEEEDIIEDVYVKDEEQTLPLALTTSSQSAECKELVQQLPPVQSEAKLHDGPESAPGFPPSTSAPPTFPPTHLQPQLTFELIKMFSVWCLIYTKRVEDFFDKGNQRSLWPPNSLRLILHT